MQRTRNGGATAPAIRRRIVDFEFALAAEAADNVDFPAHLGHRHLGAGGGHWGANDPSADALGEGRGSEQGTAGQQHAAEKRDEFASPHHSIPRLPPFAERGGFCDAMRMVEVGHGPSEALQKPSMHETAGHESSYGYLIQLVAARLRGSKKRTQRASLGTTANWVFCKLRGLLIGVLLHRSRSTGTAWAEHGRRHDGG